MTEKANTYLLIYQKGPKLLLIQLHLVIILPVSWMPYLLGICLGCQSLVEIIKWGTEIKRCASEEYCWRVGGLIDALVRM